MSAATMCDHCGQLIDFDGPDGFAVDLGLLEPEPFGHGPFERLRVDLHERCLLVWYSDWCSRIDEVAS